MLLLNAFLTRLAEEDATLVCVESTRGSAPREQGAWMAVFAGDVIGTIGGGQLEYQAIDAARARLQGRSGESVLRFPLGPSLGQCCGGVVFLRFEQVRSGDRAALATRLRAAAMPVALFGGGHVGHALIHVLGTLPCEVNWIDSRDSIFPDEVPANVICEHSEPVQLAVNDLLPSSHVLIMSFSHAEDLDIVAACLKRRRSSGDLPYIGLIGSKTKWATFRHRLRDRGFAEEELDAVTSPIGLPGIVGKEPEVIAVAVAAQLLQRRSGQAAPRRL